MKNSKNKWPKNKKTDSMFTEKVVKDQTAKWSDLTVNASVGINLKNMIRLMLINK